MRSILCLLATGVLFAFPARVSAEEQPRGNCPPGGWFCDEAESADEEPAADEATPDTGHDGDERPAPGSRRPPKYKRGPSVVVVSPGDEPPPNVVVLEKGTEPPPPPVTRPHRRRFREMGINLRLEGVLMGSSDDRTRAHDSGMMGGGISFRYRPIPHFAFDAGVDILGGRDWYGFRRNETALLLSAMVFFNPYSPVQFYLLGGVGVSGAEVNWRGTQSNPDGTTQPIAQRREYSYFGAHFGPGLEFRASRRVALNVDLLGFIRGRTDRRANTEPEFVDPGNPQRTTNTSGGGLLRGGITFYW